MAALRSQDLERARAALSAHLARSRDLRLDSFAEVDARTGPDLQPARP